MNLVPTEEAIPLLGEALAYYEEEDVRRWFERNRSIVGHYPEIKPTVIEEVRTFKKVPNEVFRKEFVKAGYSGEEVAGLRQEPEWVSLFRHELELVRAAPEGLDSLSRKIGPGKLTTGEIVSYLKRVLGIMPSSAGESLAWLLDYEVAEALCKTMGMTPVYAGI